MANSRLSEALKNRQEGFVICAVKRGGGLVRLDFATSEAQAKNIARHYSDIGKIDVYSGFRLGGKIYRRPKLVFRLHRSK